MTERATYTSEGSLNDGGLEGPAPTSTGRRLRFGFILCRSFTLSAFSLFVDTLRLAGDQLDRSRRVNADWEVVSSTGRFVKSSCGISVVPTVGLVEPDQFDMMVVVGGLLSDETACDHSTLKYIQLAARKRIPLIGLCTGSFVLADAGLLGRHESCVSWLHYDAFRNRYPNLKVRPDRLFNFDGLFGSCAGGASAADFAASIVRSKLGRDAQQNALDILQISKPRDNWDSQTRVPIRPPIADGEEKSGLDARVNATLLLMEQRLADPLEIEELASAVGLSRRQLERLYLRDLRMSPAEAYCSLRLRRAKQLVISTSRPFIDIAVDVGFTSASHMARSFRRVYGHSPSVLRTEAV